MRIAAVMAGICAQLIGTACWAADPPEACTAELTDQEVSVSTNADTDDKKVTEIVDKIVEKLPHTFAIPRHEELEQIVTGITREMVERQQVVVADLSAGIVAACTALQTEGSLPFAAAAAEGFKAAKLPPPQTISAKFAATGSAESGSEYAFMTGVVNSLEANGSWEGSVEASLISTTQFFGRALDPAEERAGQPASLNWSDLLDNARGFGRFEVTYSAIGKIDDEDAGPTTNPFAAGGGILRLNVGPEVVSGQGWFGLTAGMGLTTQPSDTETEDAEVDARRRWYAGLLFLADYGSSEENADHVTGRVALGYSDDKFWQWTQTIDNNGTPLEIERDERKRWFLDARIDGPGVFQSKSVKLSLRLFIDHPKSGNGPTDVRVSLLVTADLGLLFGS